MHWNIDPVIVFLGPIELRYYGVFFAIGLLLCAWKAPEYFDWYRLPRDHAERLTLWVPVGMLLGAHYIHLLFYETHGLFDFPHFDSDGNFVLGRFFGLGSGLASHGGALGCFIALLLFWYRNGKPLNLGFFRYTDAVMISSIWVYPWVRLGNFMNSEIVGRPTDGPFGVIFDRYYTEPRHPVQLYEAALYFGELAFAVWFAKRTARKLRTGTTFLFFLAIHFTLRFGAEFFKESQGVDEGWPYHLNMGHALSAPIVIVCLFLILATKRFNILTPLTPKELADEEAVDEAWRARGGPGGGAEPVVTAGDHDSEDATSDEEPAKPRKKKKSGKSRKAST